jgi:hypothetical protein
MSAPDSAATAQVDTSASDLSAQAIALASAIDAAIARDGAAEVLSEEAIQALMSCAAKTYAARVEATEFFAPYAGRSPLAPTDVMVTASGLLRAANLAVFELGMWQSWTGR